ncbi:DUF255 domain-containing protein [Porticoccaceae bacterium LTM1]|nr:DUF255 domain-containing protein [Porticoccaceae bacterium LTM1]
MKKIILFIVAAWMAPVCFAGGIEFFDGTWEELLEKAKTEDKKIFVDVYTQWCGPCKMMAAEVFPQEKVGEFYNAHFINFKLDAEDEEVDGPELAERYQVNLYPTYLFLNSDGELLYRSSSRMSAPVFLEVAREALGMSGDSFEVMAEKYESGNRDPEFVRNYLVKAKLAVNSMSREERSSATLKFKQVLDDYYASRAESDLINAQDFALIKVYGYSRGEKQIEFLISHYEEFSKVVSEKEVAEFLVKVNDHSIGYLARTGKKQYQTYLEEIRGNLRQAYTVASQDSRKGVGAYDDMRLTASFDFAVAQQDWSAMLDAARKNVEARGDQADWEVWFNIPRSLIYRCKDQDVLEGVVEYAKRAYELAGNFKTASMYGELLVKVDQGEKAKPVLQKALVLLGKESIKAKEHAKKRLKTMLDSL